MKKTPKKYYTQLLETEGKIVKHFLLLQQSPTGLKMPDISGQRANQKQNSEMLANVMAHGF